MVDYSDEERAEIRQKALDALADADENKQLLAARTAANKNARLLTEAQSMAAQQPKPNPAPVAVSTQRDDGWAAWRDWGNAVNQRIATIARDHASTEAIAEAVGVVLKGEREARQAEVKTAVATLEDRLAKSEQAVCDLLQQLEDRVAAIEKTAIVKTARPRLIGGADAA